MSSLTLDQLVNGQMYVLKLVNKPGFTYLVRYAGVNLSDTLNFAIIRVLDGNSWDRFTDDDFDGINSRRPKNRVYYKSDINKDKQDGYYVYSLDIVNVPVPDEIPAFEEPWSGGGKRKSMRKSKRRKSKRRKSKRHKSMRLFPF
jgi:hypothetical protein